MMQNARQRLIIVLGMHRSGTSALTRGLKALGVQLGDRLIPAIEGDNEKGFWEDLDVNGFNIELMRHLGRDWHALQPIHSSAFEGEDLASFRLRAVELVRKKIKGAAVFGIKDPRTVRLLPFWKSVFEHLGADVAYVIALRHPISVARSLRQRHGFDEEKTHYLWIQHMVPGILGSEGSPRVVVSYDSLMDRPEAELRRIAEALDLHYADSEDGIDEYKGEFLEERLRHTRFQLEDLGLDPAVPKETVEAYALLEKLARDELSIDSAEVRKSFRCLEQRIQEIFPALRYMTRRDGEIAQLTRTLADRDGQVTGLKEALAGREFENARLTQAIAERDGRIAEIESATKTQNQRIAQQETDLSNLAAEKNRLLQERDRCVAQLTTERDALVQEGAQLSVKNAELAERYETQTSILREKDLQLKQHKLEQEHLNSELFRLGSVVQYQNMTLDQVYGSFGWLVTSKFRTLKDRYFFVPGSWRRRLYDSILAMVKRRFRNGRSMPNSSNSL
jgi:hypothetical protein